MSPPVGKWRLEEQEEFRVMLVYLADQLGHQSETSCRILCAKEQRGEK